MNATDRLVVRERLGIALDTSGYFGFGNFFMRDIVCMQRERFDTWGKKRKFFDFFKLTSFVGNYRRLNERCLHMTGVA